LFNRPLMVGLERNPAPNAGAANASFNPTMVRLLPRQHPTLLPETHNLSIPQ
jgi:hypothetical protein